MPFAQAQKLWGTCRLFRARSVVVHMHAYLRQVRARASATCRSVGASTADAPDCRTERPMRRTNAERSWRMTCCTVRPFREAMRSCKGHDPGFKWSGAPQRRWQCARSCHYYPLAH